MHTIFHARGHGTGLCVHLEADARHQCIEFTDSGEVIVATDQRATVYGGPSLEPVRSWAWPANVCAVEAIQAHRGMLYVACRVAIGKRMHVLELHVYQ